MEEKDLYVIEDSILKEIPEKKHGISRLEVPDTVQIIKSYAFFNDESVETIIFPSSVIKIEKHAICQCYNLKRIYIPRSVKVIEEDACHRCSKALEIYLEGEPQEGWTNYIEKKIVTERVITDDDDAFNFHRSSGGWSYHTYEHEVKEKHHWNSEKYKVYCNTKKF
ncbi:MAG: leucine-rich repeat protein [Erysipelotrichales bacterium]|nr:leucine-rich repeat protein [Erysipelotrichales bacterium]